MTEKEYSDLKYKIVTRENRYFLTRIVVAMFFAFIITFLIKLLDSDFDIGSTSIIVWIVIFSIAIINNPWREKEKELDELFNSKSSYEEADKELRLKYEPPKN